MKGRIGCALKWVSEYESKTYWTNEEWFKEKVKIKGSEIITTQAS